MKEVNTQYPKAWYENRLLVGMAGYICIIASGYAWIIRGAPVDLRLAMASGFVYLLGTIIDIKTSIDVSKIETQYNVRSKETSLLMSEYPNKQDYHRIMSLKGLADIASTAIAPIIPPIGLAAGLTRGLVALNNTRQIDRFLSSRKHS